MRILAALALLLQLQPLVGSALCFHDAAAKTECRMPSQGQLGTGPLSQPGAGSPSTCPSMGYCAPTAPGVPKLAEQLQITSFVHGAPALMAPSLASAGPVRPPFHPPKT